MSTKTLSHKLASLERILTPRPRIIDCTGAGEKLLAMLRAQMTPEEIALAETEEIDEETQRLFDELSDLLQQEVERIEQEYNVRFVSYDHA